MLEEKQYCLRVLYVAKLIFNKKGKIKTLAGKKNTKSLAGMLLRYIKVNLQAEMKGQEIAPQIKRDKKKKPSVLVL